jgi:hypothetical protein
MVFVKQIVLFMVLRVIYYHIYGGECMAKCKTCGTEAASPRKKWVMAGRADKTGKKTQLEIGLFDCTKCKKTFRTTLSKKKI